MAPPPPPEPAEPPVDQGDDVDAEHALQLGVLVEVVEDDLRDLAAAQLHHHAHAVLVGLVPQLGDPLDALFLDQLGPDLRPDLIYRWRREALANDGASFPGQGNKMMTEEQKEIAKFNFSTRRTGCWQTC